VIRRLLPALALLALALPAAADRLATSLEDRLAAAAFVVAGPMLEIREAPPDPRGLVRREGRIRVDQVLKGEIAAGEILAVSLPARGPGGLRSGADLEPPLDAPRLWLPTARPEGPALDRPDRILPLEDLPRAARLLAP